MKSFNNDKHERTLDLYLLILSCGSKNATFNNVMASFERRMLLHTSALK